MAKQLQVAQFFNNVGGWNSDANIANRPVNTSSEMLDARIKENGSILKRMGDVSLGGINSESASNRGLYQFADSSNTLRQISIEGTNVYNLNINTPGRTSLNSTLTDNDTRIYDFCVYDHRAVMTEINEDVIVWNGTDTTTTKLQNIQGKTALTGTLTFSSGSTAVTGSGTTFTTELSVGDYISKAGTVGNPGAVIGWYEVKTITDNTNLVLRTAASAVDDGAGGAGTSYVSEDFGKAKYCVTFENHLFTFYTNEAVTDESTTVKNKMWYSALNEPYNFPTNNNHVFRKAGAIYGAFIQEGNLIVKTDLGLHQVSYTGDNDSPFIVNEIEGAEGGTNGYSDRVVQSSPLGKEIAVWMDSKGIKIYHDGITENLTHSKLDIELSNLEPTRFKYITSCVNSRFNEVWFFVTQDGGAVNTRIWAYNYALNIIYPFSGNWSAGFDMEFSDGTKYPVTGDTNGYITKHNVGYTGTRSSIKFKYVTPFYDLEQPFSYKTFRMLQVTGKVSGSVVVNLEYRLDYSETWTSTDNIDLSAASGSGFPYTFPFALAGDNSYTDRYVGIATRPVKRIQFRFKNSTAGDELEVPGWTLYYKTKPGTRGVFNA